MINGDYGGIASVLPEFERYGFKKLPVHVEEAALVYQLMNEGITLNIGNLAIDERTLLRFNQFLQTFSFYNNDLKTAEPALKQRFGNTYWYYAFYR